jgi:hypothetical protein
MGYNVAINTTVCSQLKTSYLKIVVPFEDYVKRVKLAGGTPPPDPTILNDDVPILSDLADKINATPKESNGAESLATPLSDADGPAGRAEATLDKVRTASDKLNEALNTDGKSGGSSLISKRKAASSADFIVEQLPSPSSPVFFLFETSRSLLTTILPAK